MRWIRMGTVVSATGLAVALGSAGLAAPSALGSTATGINRPVVPVPGPGGVAARGPLNQIESSNWSGYAVTNFETGNTYTAASGTWVVPSASQAPGYSSAYSSSWVGIGGFCENSGCTSVDSTLIQLGTSQDWSSSGGPTYSAWYELLPNGPVSIPLTITAGDTVTVSLTDGPAPTTAGSSTKPSAKPGGGSGHGGGNGGGNGGGGGSTGQSWILSMSVNGGTPWTTTLTYDSSLLSAEWIEEAPTGCIGHHCEVLPLANYGTTTFDLGTVTTSGATTSVSPNLTLSDAIVMVDPAGEISNPSSPDLGDTTGADGFATCWQNGSTPTTSCPPPSS